MAPLNSYLAYKRDTSRLIYWIVKASNVIIASSSDLPEDAPQAAITNGQVTVSGLIALSKLIAKHLGPIPPAILKLFDTVIRARTTAYETFQQFVSSKPDPDMERSNASHKYFINALTEAFEALGGPAWAEKKTSKPAGPTVNDQAELENVLFANSFAALNLDKDTAPGEDASDSDSDSDGDHRQSQARQTSRKKKSYGKSKKRKTGKSVKRKGKQRQQPTNTPSLDEVPLESYRIIQDKEGIITDYLMAVYALIQEWTGLRVYLQKIWRDVAYSGLNSAVAGTISNIAIKMIERSASAMFVHFPGHDSFETVMNTITRGDPEKAQGMFSIAHHWISFDRTQQRKIREIQINVKEQFLIHAYTDLLDFITDFQKNRNGKPTKNMLKQIGNFNPTFNLQRATEAERLNWRRRYTINWLFDLVNVFSSVVVQQNTKQGEHHKLESVDWTDANHFKSHRRLFGLNEFAGIITHLAFQKPGTDVRDKILPHHVFQLQCIVDSMTVCRGWSISPVNGHIIEAPPPKFRPRRDVDLFLDRDNKRHGSGFLSGVSTLKNYFEMDGALQGDPNRHDQHYRLLETLQIDFDNWLGESLYGMHGLADIPPSRFSSTNSNGLWEYSPFLCGVGLTEGLVAAYRASFVVLDKIPEPILLIHLHNMLVQKGYISEPVGLYAGFQELFTGSLFANGQVPTSDFGKALLARTAQLPSERRRAYWTAKDYKTLTANAFFTSKSFLMLCEEAEWNIDRIPDSEVPIPSCLSILLIGQTEQIVHPVTGQKRMKSTELVKRARAAGIAEETLLEWATSYPGHDAEARSVLEEFQKDAARKGYTMDLPDQGTRREVKNEEILDMIQIDISSDICGVVPFSSLNYVCVMAQFMSQFHQFEEELKKVRNPTYVRAYETDPKWRGDKRVGLVHLALTLQEDECLRIMAREFQNPSVGFMNHIYWDGLEDMQAFGERAMNHRLKAPMEPQCAVM